MIAPTRIETNEVNIVSLTALESKRRSKTAVSPAQWMNV
ncbi:hypothetical protein B4113_2492 [Geobacillus sp. B4113_201601]|nr:hypothetical protein B4113_2492 [Geobacillus sp. B4113_201601]